jgi:hypothetical protein
VIVGKLEGAKVVGLEVGGVDGGEVGTTVGCGDIVGSEVGVLEGVGLADGPAVGKGVTVKETAVMGPT